MTSDARSAAARVTPTRASVPASFWVGVAIPPILALAAYVWVCVFFAAHQHAFQFTSGGVRTTPQAVGLPGFNTVDIRTADGERLDAWWAPPPMPKGGIVLFLHGTPGTLAYTASRLTDLHGADLGAMAIDYRGYGGSTGSPSEAGFRIDARAAFDYIRAVAPNSKIGVFGESLGTWPAIALAGDRPVAGVLLNSPFASVRRLFEVKGPPLPYGWLMTDPFDSAALIGKVTAPVMILAGSADRNVPIAEARRLFAAAHEPKTMIETPGAGHLGAYNGVVKARALATLVRWTAPHAER